MIGVKICFIMFCDKCHDDTRQHYYIPVESKIDYDILYDGFLEMAKEEGWLYDAKGCLCPNCLKEGAE